MAVSPFHEVLLDPGMSYGSQGGPQFFTQVIAPSGGAEYRAALWPLGRGQWDISYGVKTKVSALYLMAFFRCRYGRAIGYRFRDPIDNLATNEALVNTGATIQLQKTYTDGTYSVVRTIQKPTNPSLAPGYAGMEYGGWDPTYAEFELYRNAVLMTSGYTLDYTTGIVTLSSPDEATYAWSGTFDVPVRFDVDVPLVSDDDFDIASWSDIKILELPPL